MIWLRRILASLLILLFLPLFLVILVVFRVNDTALSADFYVAQLRKADVYTFMYDDVAPAAISEFKKNSPDSPIDIEEVGAKGVAVAREVLPPEWLEKQTELVISQVVPYAVGDTDSFAIAIPLADRIETLGDVLKRELGSKDTYDLIFDRVVAPALKDALDENDGLKLSYGISLASQDIVDTGKELVPPEWIQARVEDVVDQLVPYFTGKADHFALQIPVADRIEAAVPPAKRLLVSAHVYEVVNSQEFAEAVDKQLTDFGELPFGLQLTGDQLVKALREVVTPQWLQARVEAVLDQVVPYVAGSQEHFEVVFPLKDRIKVAVPAAKQLLRDAKAYDQVFDQVLVTLIQDNMGQLTELPLGVTLDSQKDIIPVLREVLPPEFIQKQVEGMLDEVAPYLTGDKDTFQVVVPLSERKEAALGAINQLVDKKLQELATSLPKCTVQEALDLVQGGFTGGLPPCLPTGYTDAEIKQALGINVPGLTIEQIGQQLGVDLTIVTQGVTAAKIKEAFGIDVVGQVAQLLGDYLKDYTFVEADLRKILGPESGKLLDDALDYTRNGFTFTDADLRERLDASAQETLDTALDYTRNGFTLTDADLRERLDASAQETLDTALDYTRNGFTFTDADLRELVADDEEAAASFEQFDQARRWLGLARSLWFVPLLVLAGLLAAIGFLGGRGWRSRLAWAAVPLGIAAGIAFVAFGPVYQGVAEPLVDDALAEVTRDTTGVQQMMAAKGVAIVKTVVDDFVSGLANRALLLLAISVLAVALAILWSTLNRLMRGGPREEPAPPSLGPEEPAREELRQPEPDQGASVPEAPGPSEEAKQPPTEDTQR